MLNYPAKCNYMIKWATFVEINMTTLLSARHLENHVWSFPS